MICLLEVGHADSATLVAASVFVHDLSVVRFSVHLGQFTVHANFAYRSSLINFRVLDLGGLVALKVPDPDSLSYHLIESCEYNRQDHDPEEHDKEVKQQNSLSHTDERHELICVS